jgi:hypothetical protein
MRIYGWVQHLPVQKKPFVKAILKRLIAEWPKGGGKKAKEI